MMFPFLAAVGGAVPHIAPIPDDAGEEVVVIASSREVPLTVRELRAAVSAFHKHRPRYAPSSSLWFEVMPRHLGQPVDDVELQLVNGAKRIALQIGANRRFQLPPIAGDGWRLVSVGRRIPLKIRPWVISPRTQFGDFRLGDLQLQCRVVWAIEKQSASFVVAGLFEAAGGCSSSRIAIYQDLGRPIESAFVEEGASRARISTSRLGTGLRLPTHLKSYGSEARVRVTFQ